MKIKERKTPSIYEEAIKRLLIIEESGYWKRWSSTERPLDIPGNPFLKSARRNKNAGWKCGLVRKRKNGQNFCLMKKQKRLLIR